MRMKRAAGKWLGLGALLIGCVFLSAARADTPGAWLDRAAAAAKQLNYSGVYVYHHGEHVEVLRVLHRTDPRGELEKIEVLDDLPRQFLRINKDVYCHLSDGRNVRLERNAPRRFFPAMLPDRPQALLDYYEAALAGSDRVAGRPCQVLVLKPRDAYRHTFTLWLDRQSGLPLKSRIDNANGGLVSMFVFSEVQVGKAPDPGEFRNSLSGKRILRASLDEPADPGWNVKPPPGFERMQVAVRPMPGKKAPVTHMMFSDGLSVLSMFIEPADPQGGNLRGLSAEGAIGIYARSVDGYSVMTLGEVPSAALIETGNSVSKK